ncbi:MAG: hypothetical protein PW788_03185 [Micavibrio sp.]|nr:hypothetical protein [Micavibrio sp.]
MFNPKTVVTSVALAALIMSVATAAQAAESAQAPAAYSNAAVANPNFDLSTGAAIIDHDAKAIISGTATVPIGNSFGAQLDGSEALGEGLNRGGLAGHIFYRDPSKYLLGATAMWSRVGSDDITRVGPEAEGYWGDFTARLAGGWQSDDDDDTGYINTRLSYYVTDNIVVAAGAGAFSNNRSAGLDAEWQPDAVPFSVFAAAGDTNESDGYGILGVRLPLGSQGVTLKDRQRRYDPPNIVESFTTGESGSIQKQSKSVPPPI